MGNANFKIYLVLVSAIVLLATMLLRDCGGKQNVSKDTVWVDGNPYEKVSHTSDTIYKDTTIVKYRAGSSIIRDTTIYLSAPINVDTALILKAYYARNVYSDTLRFDSLGYVAVRDTISRNSIVGRRYYASLRERTVKDLTIVKEPRRGSLWLGMGFSSNITTDVSLLYQSKKEWGVQIGATLDGKDIYYRSAFFYRLTK